MSKNTTYAWHPNWEEGQNLLEQGNRALKAKTFPIALKYGQTSLTHLQAVANSIDDKNPYYTQLQTYLFEARSLVAQSAFELARHDVSEPLYTLAITNFEETAKSAPSHQQNLATAVNKYGLLLLEQSRVLFEQGDIANAYTKIQASLDQLKLAHETAISATWHTPKEKQQKVHLFKQNVLHVMDLLAMKVSQINETPEEAIECFAKAANNYANDVTMANSLKHKIADVLHTCSIRLYNKLYHNNTKLSKAIEYERLAFQCDPTAPDIKGHLTYLTEEAQALGVIGWDETVY